jgi:predicted dehydrogenase
MEPLRVAIIGMGGFAGVHHDVVARLEASGEYRLMATCDPSMDRFAERRTALRFAERGVRVFGDYLALLDACRADLDVVTIPTPIPLHAPMHRACVERGLAVYLEKPPTLDPVELEGMLAVEAKAGRQTNVGFNFIIEPERQALKRRLAAGEFGRVERVTVYALWPRNTTYYGRADWAGRLQKDGRPVLDSCIGNAMAHQVHNGLFWCGTNEPWAWGELDRVEAELYRAHAIEGLDTAFIAATTRQEVPLRIGMSHACHGTEGQEECVICERAVIRFHIFNSGPGGALCSVTWKDGRVETERPAKRELVGDNFKAYAAYVRGEAARPATRLIDSRPFVHLNNLAYIAAGAIATVAAPHARPGPDGYLAVAELPEAVAEFIRDGRFPSRQGRPWAVAGGAATPADLPKLGDVVRRMAAARAAERAQ